MSLTRWHLKGDLEEVVVTGKSRNSTPGREISKCSSPEVR